MVSRPRTRGLGLGLEFFKKVLTTTLVEVKIQKGSPEGKSDYGGKDL